jgi:protein tyrosine phosphatase
VVSVGPDAITKNRKITTSAVFVDGCGEKNQFIATQVPRKEKVGEFWCLVKQNHVKQIVILNQQMPDEVKNS